MVMKGKHLGWVASAVFLVATVSPAVGQEQQPVTSPESVGPPPATSPASQPSEIGQPKLQRRNPRYRLCNGDVLELNFRFTPEFNQTVTVQPDGFITLHVLGDMHVEGKTLPELTETLRAAYGKILHNPTFTVDLKDFEKPYFIVAGEVGRPGKYDLRGDTTVMQAVAMAGGLTSSSKHSQVLLFRGVSDDWVEVKQVDLKHMLKAKTLAEDLHLQAGDLVFVPKNTVSKISSFIPRPSLGAYLTPYGW
jgi:polysaccharide export outer membrane protein